PSARGAAAAVHARADDARGVARVVPAARARPGRRRAVTPAYSLITPVHNEADNLERLVASVAAQAELPSRWVLVENGSTDDTPALARAAAEAHDWIDVVTAAGVQSRERGLPIVHALHAGVDALRPFPDYVAQLDADL